MSVLAATRIPCALLLAASLQLGCAGGRMNLMPSAGEGSNSQSGQSGGGQSSGNSNSDNSQSQNSGSSEGSSDSHSETSGTMTTEDANGGSGGTNIGLYLLTGALLLTGTSGAFTWLAMRDEPGKYVAQHDREIRLALVRGDGHFVRDVADNLALTADELPVLAATLRNARPALEPFLGEGSVSPERGLAFAEALARAIEAEPRLAARFAALKARAEALLVAPNAPGT